MLIDNFLSFFSKVSIWCFNFLSCSLSAVITFHNRENIPKCGICVANHTTPIDVMVLHCDNSYALVLWTWGGYQCDPYFTIYQHPWVDWPTSRRILGDYSTSFSTRFFTYLVRALRSKRPRNSREKVCFKLQMKGKCCLNLYSLNRLKEHVDDPDKLPILIFPEGTCINNTSVMQFKKGSFEVGSVVYPVAIKVWFFQSFVN